MARILVVEHDPAATGRAGAILRASGHAVRICREPGESVALIRADMPDLVVINTSFSGDIGGGIALARSLSADPHLCHIPLLLLSDVNRASGLPFVLGESDISEDFLPVDAFLDRPVQGERLLATVGRLLAPAGRHPRRGCGRLPAG